MKMKQLIRTGCFTVGAFGLAFWLLAQPFKAHTQSHTITVQVDKPRAAVSPNQYGIFFEDINFGADGGIYAELIKNRSFEFPAGLMGWSKLGATGEARVLESENRQTNNRHYLQLRGTGISNNGFRGIGISQGAEYLFSLQARNTGGAPVGLRVELVNASGKPVAQARLRGIKGDWKTYRFTLRATATEANAQLNLIPESGGALDLDVVSLFPKATWSGRAKVLRADLVQLLKDLQPAFIRFPGGCIVEGRNLSERYQWKTTLGDPAERKLLINRWNLEFKTRNPERAPADYFQSFGLGFFEYFELCEDVGAEPLPILNCGMACQFNTGELVPLDQLDPYIQDALDLIEFANGSVVTPWGRKRAELGHPTPFNMKLLGVGNEQWGPDYIPRYEAFAKAIKAKYPNITLVSSAGPFPDGDRFNFLWDKLRALNADSVDEHYYRPPKWFLDNANRYNDYPRTGPKVFAGEYAAHVTVQGRPDRPNNWEAALAEAAFLTGLDRNADVVTMASYAPLFAHVDAWQWSPNLIWFDNLRSFGTPSYYVQKLFSQQRGTDILPVTVNGAAQNGQQQLYTSALWQGKTNEVILKLVNTSPTSMIVHINLSGAGRITKPAQVIRLASDDLKTENSLDAPKRLAPVEQQAVLKAAEFDQTLPPQSLTVLRVLCAK
ncbi:MAG: carbohydrate binding domain-containing protein [Acidobacteria bacterium]|nr:carbohydrate binding domain-containing protein [Acidobacteriota bacterium]MBI3426405.1 carbohydrate binding domain-containing protein [Acidobacteriota bacterium]